MIVQEHIPIPKNPNAALADECRVCNRDIAKLQASEVTAEPVDRWVHGRRVF